MRQSESSRQESVLGYLTVTLIELFSRLHLVVGLLFRLSTHPHFFVGFGRHSQERAHKALCVFYIRVTPLGHFSVRLSAQDRTEGWPLRFRFLDRLKFSRHKHHGDFRRTK